LLEDKDYEQIEHSPLPFYKKELIEKKISSPSKKIFENQKEYLKESTFNEQIIYSKPKIYDLNVSCEGSGKSSTYQNVKRLISLKEANLSYMKYKKSIKFEHKERALLNQKDNNLRSKNVTFENNRLNLIPSALQTKNIRHESGFNVSPCKQKNYVKGPSLMKLNLFKLKSAHKDDLKTSKSQDKRPYRIIYNSNSQIHKK